MMHVGTFLKFAASPCQSCRGFLFVLGLGRCSAACPGRGRPGGNGRPARKDLECDILRTVRRTISQSVAKSMG
ncbi:hypothetical protein F4819DRAFT_439834 [Hypoxylon fuscum]|nr:hypothetical protein F4819DRAFT_439834 [Hypoxylon fuscum]